MKWFLALFLILNTLLIQKSFAYFESAASSTPAVMNDIKFDDYKEFTKKWHLVTVRYRKDSNEMRITYANDIAWKEMQKLKPNYPDGAVFGKVGLTTEEDPAFISSEVPSGAKRFQLMVRNQKKYKSTQGWGYALFDEKGQLYNEDMKVKTAACAACHSVVPERDYVFSRPMNVDFGSQFPNQERSDNLTPRFKFESKTVASLGKNLASKIAPDIKTILSLEGEIKEHAFSGTLDEVIPVLIDNLKKQGKSSVLFLDDKNFSLVTPATTSKECLNKTLAVQIFILFNGSKVRDKVICQ